MIAIAGYLGSAPEDAEDKVREMLVAMRDRGEGRPSIIRRGGLVLGGFSAMEQSQAISDQIQFSDDGSLVGILEGSLYGESLDTLINEYHARGIQSILDALDGPFSLAICDFERQELLLARDRFGQKPMFVAYAEHGMYFGSGLAAIRAAVGAEQVDAQYLRDLCAAWSGLGEHTFYQGIRAVPCGKYLLLGQQGEQVHDHDRLDFSKKNYLVSEEALINELDLLLQKAIQKRLEGGTNAAFYLSGGLDSSLLAAMAKRFYGKQKQKTFSIAFDDTAYDESEYQDIMVKHLDSDHCKVKFDASMAADALIEMVARVQTPVMRLGMAPMISLARAVRLSGTNAVFSGEGADELFGGYDLFKEVLVREFVARDPDSMKRQKLYKRLYPYVSGFGSQSAAALNAFFSHAPLDRPLSSHQSRFGFAQYCKQFFTPEIKSVWTEYDFEQEILKDLPPNWNAFSNVERAQYIEILTFHNRYLIEQQADAINMGLGVSCLCPFLDKGVSNFGLGLTDAQRISGLYEKYLLRQVAKRYLPRALLERRKFPYRAPIAHRELMTDARIMHVLTAEKLEAGEIWQPDAASAFLKKMAQKEHLSEKEQMLLVLMISAQLLRFPPQQDDEP